MNFKVVTCADRVPYFSYVLLNRVCIAYYYKYAYFVILRHPVTTLVTAFNNPNKLTNDLLIFKLIDILVLKKLNRSLRLVLKVPKKNLSSKWTPCSLFLLSYKWFWSHLHHPILYYLVHLQNLAKKILDFGMFPEFGRLVFRLWLYSTLIDGSLSIPVLILYFGIFPLQTLRDDKWENKFKGYQTSRLQGERWS